MDPCLELVCNCSKDFKFNLSENNRTFFSNDNRRVIVSKDFKMSKLLVLILLSALFTTAYGCGPGRGIGGPRKYRKLTPLVFKEHYPKMAEKALGASGLAEGRISRNSTKFKDLVPNYNTDIIFKDEEGTGADRLMSKRCKEILNILAVSVMNQWPGVRLRVIESWDEDNFHGEESLHYEGRAVDITTSDRDTSKYGMLARLAVEAGFDWVYYECRSHIHCSVKSDSAAHSNRFHHNGCFAKDSTVLTKNGDRKAISDVQIGEQILSMNDQGAAVYSEVILFMDRNLDQQQNFVQIKTNGGATLTVTPAHLIWAWNKEKSLNSYTFADKIEEGDSVLVHDETGHLRPQLVIEVTAKQSNGYVAPLTREGTIVVDHVVASCYAVVNSQGIAHWSLAPMRLWSSFKHLWTSSKSSDLTNKPKILTNKTKLSVKASSTTTAQQQNGVHWYAKTLYTLKDFIVPPSWRYKVFHS